MGKAKELTNKFQILEASKDIISKSRKAKKSLQSVFDNMVDLKIAIMKDEEAEGRDGKLLVKGLEKDIQAVLKMRDSKDFNRK